MFFQAGQPGWSRFGDKKNRRERILHFIPFRKTAI
jgi:hypothetical protein